MFKRTLFILLILLGGCNDNAKHANATQEATTAPASTVAVTKPPLPHTASDLKKALHTTPTLADNSIQQGAKLARKCFTCHSRSNTKKVGPGLASIYNRKAGSMPDMQYSPQLHNANWQWDTPHLSAWLCNSNKALQTFSGNANARSTMPSQHICDSSQQTNLIAYLKTL